MGSVTQVIWCSVTQQMSQSPVSQAHMLHALCGQGVNMLQCCILMMMRPGTHKTLLAGELNVTEGMSGKCVQ